MKAISSKELAQHAHVYAKGVYEYLHSPDSLVSADELNEWLDEVFDGKYKLWHLLAANTVQLANIAASYDTKQARSFPFDFKSVLRLFTAKKTTISSVPEDGSWYRIVADWHQTCPCCNLEPIAVFRRAKQPDIHFIHFYLPQQYPFLQLSFYNLIPCCLHCYALRGKSALSISPYDEKYGNTRVYAPYYFTEAWANRASVTCLAENLEDNATVFKLTERFSALLKAEDKRIEAGMYPDLYLEYLAEKYSGLLFTTSSEIKLSQKRNDKISM